MKERFFGDASWVEIVLISVTIIIYAIMALLIVASDVKPSEFFARPLLEITVGEFVSIMFAIGWIVVVLGGRR